MDLQTRIREVFPLAPGCMAGSGIFLHSGMDNIVITQLNGDVGHGELVNKQRFRMLKDYADGPCSNFTEHGHDVDGLLLA